MKAPGKKWKRTRWWRCVLPDGTLWAESSNEQEIRRKAKEKGLTPQVLFEKTDYKWVDAE